MFSKKGCCFWFSALEPFIFRVKIVFLLGFYPRWKRFASWLPHIKGVPGRLC